MIITANVCDVCPEDDVIAKPFSVVINETRVRVDLCAKHEKEMFGAIAQYLEAGTDVDAPVNRRRTPGNKKPTHSVCFCGFEGSDYAVGKHAKEVHNAALQVVAGDQNGKPEVRCLHEDDEGNVCGFGLTDIPHLAIHWNMHGGIPERDKPLRPESKRFGRYGTLNTAAVTR